MYCMVCDVYGLSTHITCVCIHMRVSRTVVQYNMNCYFKYDTIITNNEHLPLRRRSAHNALCMRHNFVQVNMRRSEKVNKTKNEERKARRKKFG